MKSIFADVIAKGGFDLNGLTEKINKYNVEGIISNADRDELLASARGKAEPSGSYGKWQDEIAKVWEAIEGLREEIKNQPVQPEPTEPVEEYPPFVQPTGAHDAYSFGDKFTYNGKKYEVILPGVKNFVWNPDTYPAGVKAVK